MSAPILVACAAACLALTVPVAASAASLEAAHRVRGAADAAALGWIDGEPCERAGHVVAAAGARLDECLVDGENYEARVRASAWTVLGTVHAHARAGPPPGWF